jgi:phosphatidylglycerophosphate synthase
MTGDAVTPTGFSAAMRTLRERQKTSKGAPAYSLLVNRPFGRLLAATAYVLGRTPNQVTALSALCTFAGIATIAFVAPGPITGVLVAALLVVGYALDAADGQLARLRGGGSVSGEWLDHAVDALKISTLHLAVCIGWFRFLDVGDMWLLVPLAYSATATTTFFIIILNDQLRRAHRGTTQMLLQGEGSSSPLYALAVVPTDYGLLCLSFVLFGWGTVFLPVYTLLMASNLAFLAVATVKWYREMRTY